MANVSSYRPTLRFNRLLICGLIGALTCLGSAHAAPQRLALDALDSAKIAADKKSGKSGVYRYAVHKTMAAQQLAQGIDATLSEGWSLLADGQMQFQAEIFAAKATSIDVLLHPFRLPHGATLIAFSADGKQQLGPYTDQDNTSSLSLPLPIITGERMLLQLTLPADQRANLQFALAAVNQGYRSFDGSDVSAKTAGGCNVDSVCPQGDDYRDQIRAVTQITINGGSCTGSFVNNTRADRSPLLLTARHCLETQGEATALVAYHNYQSTVCRPLRNTAFSSPAPTNFAQSGSTLLATSARSDVTLLRMNSDFPNGSNPHWLGWDRRDLFPARVAVIHHPQGEEKRISLENNPTGITTTTFTAGSIVLAPGTGINVPNWDVGTTEQGSSGSSLMDQSTKRVVGTLSGGGAACSGTTNNGQNDVFGRLFTGWEGQGTPSSRLKDHLDPIGTGAQFQEGLATCAQPAVQLNVTGALTAGTDIRFTATASGATGPYRYEWDLDGDGAIDRSGVGLDTLSTRYNRPLSINASVKVTDAQSCARVVSRALDVSAHDVRLSTVRAAEQLCGDGDASFDPGERWKINAELSNFSLATQPSAYAQFSAPALGGGNLSEPDVAGYRYSDSSGLCPTTFADLSAIAPLNLVPARPNFTATDDGRSATLNLGANAFDFYGQSISSIVMSTNGYFILNPTAANTGEDFEPNCTSTPDADPGKRIRPLHADLQVSSLKASSAASCPRPSTVGSASQPCVILEWSGAQFLDSAFVAQPGQFDMQALIYPQTRQIVFQYRGVLNQTLLSGAVAGLMNDSGSPLNYQCETSGPATVSVGRAVCFFNPQNLPAGTGTSVLTLTKAAVNVGAIASGASAPASAEVAISPIAACGSNASLNFVGVADERSQSTVSRGISVNIPTTCNVVAGCAAPASVALRGGSFFNPQRSGNGLVAFIIPQPAPMLPTFFGAWFTGEKSRIPTWYIVQGDLAGNSSNSKIYRVTRTVEDPLTVSSAIVGDAQISMVDRERLVFSYQFDSGAEAGYRGVEVMQHLLAGLQPSAPDVTGHYYNPAQSGWGQTYESFVANGVATQFVLSYLYDTAGNPRWVLSQEPDSASTLPSKVFETHCPSCAWLDIGPTAADAGTQSRQFQGFGRATIGTQITFPARYPGSWTRSGFSIQALSVPNQ